MRFTHIRKLPIIVGLMDISQSIADTAATLNCDIKTVPANEAITKPFKWPVENNRKHSFTCSIVWDCVSTICGCVPIHWLCAWLRVRWKGSGDPNKTMLYIWIMGGVEVMCDAESKEHWPVWVSEVIGGGPAKVTESQRVNREAQESQYRGDWRRACDSHSMRSRGRVKSYVRLTPNALVRPATLRTSYPIERVLKHYNRPTKHCTSWRWNKWDECQIIDRVYE